MTHSYSHVTVKTSQTESGEALFQILCDKLHIWGGMSHSTEPDEDGRHDVTFDPHSCTLPALLKLLDGMMTEYAVSIKRWTDEA